MRVWGYNDLMRSLLADDGSLQWIADIRTQHFLEPFNFDHSALLHAYSYWNGPFLFLSVLAHANKLSDPIRIPYLWHFGYETDLRWMHSYNLHLSPPSRSRVC